LNVASEASSASDGGRLLWFRQFLEAELAPYPGRAALVARIVISATMVMLIVMTFRIPGGAIPAFYTFLISRENLRATVTVVKRIAVTYSLAAICVLIVSTVSLGDPLLRLVAISVMLFVVSFAISALTDYLAALSCGILVAVTLPLWDRHISIHDKVNQTLWYVGGILIAGLVTIVVEVVYAQWKPGNDLLVSIAGRLTAVENLLAGCAEGRPEDEAVQKRVQWYALLGISRLRRILARAGHSPYYRQQMGAVMGVVGHLVDLAAELTHSTIHPSDDDRTRLHALTGSIARIRKDLLSERVPARSEDSSGEREPSPGVPLLEKMERTTWLIRELLGGLESLDAYAPSPSSGDPPLSLLAPDALTNDEHMKFALKLCLATSACHILYTSLDWFDAFTAVQACLLTALTTIGASHQNQVLRITGVLTGGFVLGMGAQVFAMPYIDSIGGFTLLYVVVNACAGWIATSSPRLSYFGVQAGLAFYYVAFDGFAIPSSLLVVRDRVLGFLMGFCMMWLVFDQFWRRSAAVAMKRAFISTLRLVAELAREPATDAPSVAVARTYSLRETINRSFDGVRAYADGVLFEFGPSRPQNLALRDRIRRWTLELRLIFVVQVALLKYRLQVPGFELPEPVRAAQRELYERVVTALQDMADRIEGKAAKRADVVAAAFEHLEQTAWACCAEGEHRVLPDRVRTFLTLSRRVAYLTTSLSVEIGAG
jgi:multidrug resistance protein MdtO